MSNTNNLPESREEGQFEGRMMVNTLDGVMYLSWYQRKVLEAWFKWQRYDKCVEAVKGHYKGRAIKKWLSKEWVQRYIREECRVRGWSKEDTLKLLIRDVTREPGKCKDCYQGDTGLGVCKKCNGTGTVEFRLDEGQRDSLKVIAKIMGHLGESNTNVMIGQVFDVRQGNGDR